ncbi:AMP-binding protein [Thermodesulfobacteriota bacterium]
MIKARIRPVNPDANLKSYFRKYREFSWEDVEKEFSGYDPGRLNIVDHSVDRWAEHPEKKDQWALVVEKGGKIDRFSYWRLRDESCRFANLLVEEGFKNGDRLFIFLPPCPEIYIAMLGCARLGVIFTNIFHTLGYDELEWSLRNAEPRAVLTHPELVERLPQGVLADSSRVFVTGESGPGIVAGELPLEGALSSMSTEFDNARFPAETPLYILYTSGSTGPPKGVVHGHQDMLGQYITAKYVLDLNEDSALWVDGNPAWVTGTVYGAFAPWLCGACSVVQGDKFSASTWYRTIETHKVSVWYTTPSNLRKLMEAGDDLPGRYDFSHFRHVASVGDTLIPDLYYWVKKCLNRVPHDTWWMTETGMICIASYPSEETRPGCIGKPVPGIEAAVLDADGEPLEILSLGELALKTPWPALMTGIWRDEERTAAYFRNGWFLTGDMVIKDEDGYYSHQGRKDDLIKAGEMFMGPYDIEGVLRLHPAVAEAAVIAKSSDRAKTSVKAFVTVTEDHTPSMRLNREITAFVKTNLHSEVPLTEIEFLPKLPKSRSGKMLRRALRARELGLPTGDLSKLED